MRANSMTCNVRASRVFESLFAAVFILSLAATEAAGAIVGYQVTTVLQSELSDLPQDHWAQYSSLCGKENIAKKIRFQSSLNRAFETITERKARFPFYAWGSSSWYVSSMGFLSPTPYGMCDGYCPPRFFANISGTYAFSSNSSALFGGGGDWPMIGFYVMPFQTTGAKTLESFIMALDSSTGGTAYTTVEYCNASVRDQSGLSQAHLTAQVAVHDDGTIIMRYASLPDTAELTKNMPSTGLVYSKTLREVVPTPTAANGIVAYRFDPKFDACAEHDNDLMCRADVGSDCVWCSSTSACSVRSFVSEVCPGGQWDPPATSAPTYTPQRFYAVQVDYETPFLKLPGDSQPLSSLDEGNFSFRVEGSVATIPLFRSMSFPRITCIPGVSCFTHEYKAQCAVFGNMCVNGNYTMSILALESHFFFSKSASWVTQQLPERLQGESLCDEMNGCRMGVVGQLSGAAFNNNYSSNPLFSVQLYADLSGVIDITIRCEDCAEGDSLLAYPPIRVGLVRYGVDDPSSVMIPQGLLRSGLHVRYVPQSRCVDCGLNGWCSESRGTCQCQPGYYGYSCKACPVCWTGSTCDDGKFGTGMCLCDGGPCEAACTPSLQWVLPARSCANCNAVGGRCNCGVCECQGGWSGVSCAIAPVDACRAYSFDGCEVCGQHEGCVFCHDSTCFNPALSGTHGGYTCSYSTPAADTEACVTYGSRGLIPTSRNSADRVALFGLILAVFVSLAVLVLFFFCICRNRRVPNRMAALAVPATAEFRDLHRDRQVVPVAFTRERVRNKEFMGIPLKQVSLLRLFKRRKETLAGAAPL
ncbi:hypothetical protein JKF63_03965 [Porcisia hertigi]|uniref:EGF-like domain-containing protein n=1 Tax=Porcisia hertigi TaxID=2761500 RepID=A0A836HRF8_9TRYP|nr:hypothetical protein JKF63_03965 [Porcisia hertigi]